MAGLKSLAKDTVVYGLSSIVGRFLNYLLVPLYTAKMAAESGGYGIVTNVYSYTALLLVILVYGMETALFRYCTKEGEDPKRVYSTILTSVGFTSVLFVVLVLAFLSPISGAMGYADHPEYIGVMAVVVAMDAFQAIPFSFLRQQKKAVKFALMKTTEGKYFKYDEYKTLIEGEQTDKNNKLVYLYTTDPVAQYSYIEAAKNKGYQVLVFDSQLDAHFVNLLESKFENSTFARVDADSIDNLIQKDNKEKPVLKDGQEKDLGYAFEAVLPEGAHYQVQVDNLGATTAPIMITQSEFMRRYREMSALNGGLNFYGSMPESYTITLNYENPIMKEIIDTMEGDTACKVADIKGENDEEKTAQRKAIMEEFAKGNDLMKQTVDLALLSNNMLKGKELHAFIQRSLELLKK